MAMITDTAAWAQSPDVNPYQSVLDHLPAAELKPLASAYGGIFERWSISPDNSRVPEGESPISVWSLGTDSAVGAVYLCNQQAIGFIGPISPELATEIGSKEVIVGAVPLKTLFGDGYVMMELARQDATLTFIKPGTEASMIELTYPSSVARGNGWHAACEELQP